MRYDEATERLFRPLPRRLPPAPSVLLPVRTDTGERRPPTRFDPATVRRAAVLVLIVPADGGAAAVVLTERVDRGGHHSGEVSFPGGAMEPGDAGAIGTALREAEEEIGLDGELVGVSVVGTLEPFWIPVSDFHVTPVLAVAGRRAVYRIQPDEVARVLEAPLDAFVPGAPIVMVEREVRGWPLRYGAYPVDGLLVWGATARVLGQLGALLAGP